MDTDKASRSREQAKFPVYSYETALASPNEKAPYSKSLFELDKEGYVSSVTICTTEDHDYQIRAVFKETTRNVIFTSNNFG